MPRKRSKGLSDRQKRILEVLERFQDQNGYPPSIREICEKAGISSTSVVNYYLDQLEEMGIIERDRRVSRGVRIMKPLSEMASAVGAPLRQADRRHTRSTRCEPKRPDGLISNTTRMTSRLTTPFSSWPTRSGS